MRAITSLSVKPYLAVLSSRFQMLLQYRASAVAGVLTQIFFGIMRAMVFEAFYQSAGPQPMTRAEVVTYIWLGQATLTLIMLGVDHDVMVMIRTGSVAYEMVRPIDLYNLWFARALSGRAAPLVMRSIPIALVAGLFFDLQAPASFANGALFLLAILNGLLLAASIIGLLNISLLWTVSGDGLSRVVLPLILLFSGITVPLPFFPEWLQPLVSALPLRGLIDTPSQIYLGRFSGPQAIAALAHQAVWIVALICAGGLILGRGIRKLVVQGG